MKIFKFLLILAFAIGYTLNIIAICYGLHDAFTISLKITEYINLAGVLCVRVVGLKVWPLGAVLGYF